MAPAIRIGEKAPTANLAALQNKSAKTFHHAVPGAKFIMPDGLEIIFMGGVFVTSDPAIIQELEAISDRPTSQIYTSKSVVTAIAAEQKAAASDAVQG